MNTPFHGTETDFIKHEVRAWGEDYIDSLLNKGYSAVLTSAGWKWLLPTNVKVTTNHTV